MKGKRPKVFTQAFKEEAVRMMLEGHRSHRDIAHDLGVNVSTLRDWKSRFMSREGASIELSPEQEIRKLRMENETLRMERDILKKAMAIFSDSRR